MKTIILIIPILLMACAGTPKGLEPVTGFDATRYTGKWYEIARLKNIFEDGLDHITAEYNLNNDGGLNVTNSGRNIETGVREYAYGKAFFKESPDIGSLKVSFFGPFYGGYHIIELDKDKYRYVMIAGSDRSYLWILAREPTLDEAVLKRLIARADQLGFKTEELIYPAQ
ncbi:MAG: lipocalin family protein [Methylococcaceae bacterium]|nr:lipocalin family protein [Methylococcaceae bacterium]